jgi:hypothetical protein
MSSITEGLSNLIDRMVETDRRLARRTGEYIDKTQETLRDAVTSEPSNDAKALPSASPSDFKGISDADLKKILRAYGVKGYTQRDGKKLLRKDRVQLAIENKVPALSYGFLLDFYMQRKG